MEDFDDLTQSSETASEFSRFSCPDYEAILKLTEHLSLECKGKPIPPEEQRLHTFAHPAPRALMCLSAWQGHALETHIRLARNFIIPTVVASV